jgi:preprotein translocase subunit SecY
MKNAFSGWRYLWKSQDIRRKLLITFLLLVIYRLAANIPVPGVNSGVLKSVMSSAGSSGFFAFLDLLSGGTVSNFSLLSMGVYPYITAQIIIQLLVPIFPALQRRMQEDPREGRKLQERWTYYLAVPMAALSAIGQINILNSYAASQQTGSQIIPFGFNADLWLPSLAILMTMIGGTMFAIWLGELISEYGIRGQGLSLIIFAGIVAKIPANFAALLKDKTNGWILVIAMLIVMVAVIFAIVYVQQGRRNVPVMYPGRRVGNRMSMPVKGTLPLMVNLAGMIPLIFASAILQFPTLIASWMLRSSNEGVVRFATGMRDIFSGQGNQAWVYWLLYFFFVVLLTFFYTDVMFTQQNYGDNLKKMGAQIPGVTRGAPTQKYLTRVQRRITLPGALFLGLVAILPFLINLVLTAVKINTGSSSSTLFLTTSSGLLIVVGVVRDTFMNIDAELKLHGYDEKLLVK